MDAWPIIEIRARLVFLFRALKVDTVMVYDPSGAVRAQSRSLRHRPRRRMGCGHRRHALGLSGAFLAGLKPHAPQERYYFARGPQLVNRVVDISGFMDQKVFANHGQRDARSGGQYRSAVCASRLAKQGKTLPLLGNDDDTANRQYTKHFALGRDRARGQAHGLEYAEYFHYIGPDESDVDAEYVRHNAVSL